MGWLYSKKPEMVMDLTDEQVERWREGDESVWDERTPGLLDRLIRQTARRDPEPDLEAGG